MRDTLLWLGCLALLFGVTSCKCSKLTYIEKPIFSKNRGYDFSLCKESNVHVSFAVDKKYAHSQYITTNDSLATGYVAGVNLFKNMNDIDTLIRFRVGKGSEFEAGGCIFKVIKVEYRTKYDSDSVYTSQPFILFQTLKLPKYCICQNRKLKKFEEKMQDPVFRRKATSFGLKTEEEMERRRKEDRDRYNLD